MAKRHLSCIPAMGVISSGLDARRGAMTGNGLWRRRLALAAASSCSALLLLDFTCHLALSHARWLPAGAPLAVLRRLYMNSRSYVQYDKDCARYDAALSYTLRPGRCTFANEEFKTEVRVNSLGLRDDEQSLRHPEIIVLGDSFAMGWGVQEAETFSSILERRLGKKVLNAGVSSYGTAREVESVRRLNSSRARILIIQYCDNDFEENQRYVADHYRLAPMAEADYNATVQDLAAPGRYFPGQLLARTFEVRVLYRLRRMFFGPARSPKQTGPAPRAESPDEAAALFLKILKHSGLASGRRLILVFELDAFRTGHGFLGALQRRSAQDSALNLKTLDLSRELRPEHYFRLDDHINAWGHRLVADRLYQEIGELGGDDRIRTGE